MRMTTQLKSVMKRNLTQLMSNSVTLEAPGPTGVTLVNGTPMEEQTLVAHWVGKGSIQYVRPRIQKEKGADRAHNLDLLHTEQGRCSHHLACMPILTWNEV